MRTATTHSISRLGILAGGLALACLLLALSFGTSKAEAAFGDGVAIKHFDAYPTSTQAGGHPDLMLEFEIDNRLGPVLKDPENPDSLHPCACNDAKDIIVNLPAGFIGNPHSTPQCEADEFAFDECPIDSQVGVTVASGCLQGGTCGAFPTPLYNLIPPPGEAGLLGFKVIFSNSPVYTFLTARTGGDFGLRASVRGIQREFPVPAFLQTIWGVPAAPVNDALRFKETCILTCTIAPPLVGHASNSPQTPFLSNPTTCGLSLQSTISITAYDGGVTNASSPWPPTTGCSQLDFNPSLAANPTTTKADTPSGIDVDLKVPQFQNPGVPSPSQIKGTTVTLPPGFTINPNAADGKTACLDVSAKFGSEDEAQCPEFAKIGTLEVESSVLPGTLHGAIYLGEPKPGDRYRILLVADGFGLHIKIPGSVYPDPNTGQLVTDFQNLPEAPFQRFYMHFFGAERGILATPEKCGTYPVVTTFEPWNSALSNQDSVQFFTIDGGPNGAPCPGATRPFAPEFEASSQGNTAGAHTPFTVDIERPDGDQNLSAITVKTPPGFSGALKGIPYCPEAALTQLAMLSYSGLSEQASSACPASSQIGKAIAGAGAGSKPLFVPGKVYLAGPHKGKPLSLVVVIPAVSGPYDLGNVVNRVAIDVNPVSAQVTATSDPLPQILEGIPLRTRFVRVHLDRPDFALNPTNCAPLSVEAKVSGDEGATVDRSSHYQVANCAVLPFEPKLAMSLKGGMKRTGHPALTAVLTHSSGEANLAKTVVTLPKAQILDNAHIQNPCTRVQFAKSACPASSIVGYAKAESPLLDEPLQGPVYLRSSNNLLPDIVADLEGQIDVEVSARVDSVKQRVKGSKEPANRIRTTFESIPDVPVSKFTLSMLGADKGLLYNSENLCKATQFANVSMTGQNGVQLNRRTKVSTPCKATRSSKRKNKRNRLFRARKAG